MNVFINEELYFFSKKIILKRVKHRVFCKSCTIYTFCSNSFSYKEKLKRIGDCCAYGNYYIIFKEI